MNQKTRRQRRDTIRRHRNRQRRNTIHRRNNKRRQRKTKVKGGTGTWGRTNNGIRYYVPKDWYKSRRQQMREEREEANAKQQQIEAEKNIKQQREEFRKQDAIRSAKEHQAWLTHPGIHNYSQVGKMQRRH